MKPCPTHRQLQDLLADRLDQAQQGLVEIHLETCPHCQAALEALTAAPANSLPLSRSGVCEEPLAANDPVSAMVERLVERNRSSRGDSLNGPGKPATVQAIPGYDLLGELGRGGMSVVYKARQRSLNRIVALKMILAGTHASPTAIARFCNEAEAIARLQHPNIVQVYETGDRDGLPYFTMEFVEGGTLAHGINHTPQPARSAAQLISTLARAAHYAHEHGIVHRDLKPANILLQHIARRADKETRRQRDKEKEDPNPFSSSPRITDFGLAKQLDSVVGHTLSGAVLGTPGYMAPEQAQSELGPIGPYTDVYALGAILYELLTGRPPFTGDSSLAVLRQLMHEDPIPPARLRTGLPDDVQTICLRALEREPRRRYPTAAALADDLDRYLEDKPIAARPPSWAYQCYKFGRRNKALVSGVLGVGLALLLGMVVSLVFAMGEAKQRKLAEKSAEEAEDNYHQALAARQATMREAYRARVLAAQAALNEHDVLQLARHLDAAPKDFRHWEWHYLHGQLDQSAAHIPAAADLSWIAAVPHSEGWRALALRPEAAELWDLHSGQRVSVLAKGKGVYALYLPNRFEPRFLIAGARSKLLLVDEQGQVLQSFALPEKLAEVSTAALSPDGHVLAIIFAAGPTPVYLYDVKTGNPMQVLAGNGNQRLCLAFSPDGLHLAAGDQGGHVTIWSGGARPEISRKIHGVGVSQIRFSPDSQRILSASGDQTFRQLDVGMGAVLDVRHQTSGVLAAEYSSDGRWIVTMGADRALRLWSADGGEVVGAWHGHTRPVLSLTQSRDNGQLATVGEDGIRLWDVKNGGGPGILHGHTSYVYPVAISSDGRWLASGGWDDVIRLWDMATGKPAGVCKEHHNWIVDLAFAPDSRRMVSWGNDGQLRIWEIPSGRLLGAVKHRTILAPGAPHRLAISPDGAMFAAGDLKRVRFWDFATSRELPSLDICDHWVRVLAFHADGRRLAVVWDEGPSSAVAIVDLPTRQILTKLDSPSGFVNSVSFSPDGHGLVTVGSDRVARLWNADTGKLERQMNGHTNEIFAAAFHPDGTRLATAGRDRVIRLWDVESGEQVLELRGHTSYVFSLAFDREGTTLASGSGDSTVRLWETARKGE